MIFFLTRFSSEKSNPWKWKPMKTCFFNDVLIWSNGKSRPPFHPFQNGLRKQPTFCNAFTGFPAKWHLRNKCRNSILICRVITQIWVVLLIGWKLLHPIRSAVVLHQYGISALVSQTSFHGKTGAGMVKCYVSCFIRQIPEKVMRSLNTIYIINDKSQILLSRFVLREGGNCTQACDQSILLALFWSLMINIQWCRVFLLKFTMNVTYKKINNQQITHDEISRTCISLLLEYVQSCKNIQLSPSWQKS